MNFIYSPEQEAESLLGIYSDTDASVRSRSNPMHSKFCSPDSETDCSHAFQCSVISEHLMLDPTQEELTSWLEAFPAKTSPSQAKPLDLTEKNQGFGWKWAASFAKWVPSSSTWKTRQCSLLGGLTEFSGTWPRWGLMRNGECLEPITLPLFTSEKESGFWPTPTRRDSRTLKGSQPPKRSPKSGLPLAWTIALTLTPEMRSGGRLNPEWIEWLMGWPTGWTDLQPLAMDKYREWLQQHGAS